jgi:hypothetical protein
MKESAIKKAAKDYITEQLKQNKDWFACITDSWIHDAENWFCEKFNMPNWEEPEDMPKEVELFWSFALEEKERVYKEKFGERDAFLALPGMLRYLRDIAEVFEAEKDYYIQDSPIRKGKCQTVLSDLARVIDNMEELRIKSKEKR